MEIKTFTPQEYSQKTKSNGKSESVKTVIRRCENNQLPSNAEARKVGRVWIILVGF